VHETILLSSDPISEMSESPVPAPRSKHAPKAAPTRGHRDNQARSFRHPQIQGPYGHGMPYNNFVHPQPHPMFFARPPPLIPVGHGMLLPPVAYAHTKGPPGPAASSAHHGFSHYPIPVMPMFTQPNYQPYQRMVPPSFPPNSWIPMLNFGLPSGQNSMHNPSRRP
jgi:hypothetical protein